MNSTAESVMVRFASAVSERKLEAPVVFMLELYKPLATVMASLGQMSVPVLSMFLGVDRQRELWRLLEDRTQIERLIVMIEEKARGVHASN